MSVLLTPVTFVSPGYHAHEEVSLCFFISHISPLSQVTVPLALRGGEDILVVRVSQGRGEGETVHTVIALLLVLLVVLPAQSNSL